MGMGQCINCSSLDAYSAPVLDLRCVQHSTHHFGHVRQNVDPEVCHVDIVVELSFANLQQSSRSSKERSLSFPVTHQIVDFFLSVGRGTSRGLERIEVR